MPSASTRRRSVSAGVGGRRRRAAAGWRGTPARHHALEQHAHHVEADRVGHAEGDVHGAALVGERVVILAARQVEQVARLHVHVHEQLALGLLVMLRP